MTAKAGNENGHGPTEHVEGCQCTRCTGFQVGNTLALKHGVHSETFLAPLVVSMKKGLLARMGIRQRDLSWAGREVPDSSCRAKSKVVAIDNWLEREPMIRADGTYPEVLRLYFVSLKASMRALEACVASSPTCAARTSISPARSPCSTGSGDGEGEGRSRRLPRPGRGAAALRARADDPRRRPTRREVLAADPWIEERLLRPIFERDGDGLPRYRLVYRELPRGHWKSGGAAAVALGESILNTSTDVVELTGTESRISSVGISVT